MNNKMSLLVVEEDAFEAELLADQLRGQFLTEHVDDSDDVIHTIEKISPVVVLLTIGNRKTSGLEVCKMIRAHVTLQNLPIIFLSDNASTEELFNIYEVGGDDYLPRSLTKLELCSRINHTISQCHERNQLRSQLTAAFSVAMTAMSSAAEVGEILQFLRNSFACSDYLSLCNTVLQTLTAFGLDGRVQIRGQQHTASYNALGPCSQVEESVFATMAKEGRLISFSTHCACSYEHVTLIIKNMPREDADRYGRMSDNLALLCEAVNERVIALDKEIYIAEQKVVYQQLVDVVNQSLVDMNQQLMQKLYHEISECHAHYQRQSAAILALPELGAATIKNITQIYAEHQLTEQLAALMLQLDGQPSESSVAPTQIA